VDLNTKPEKEATDKSFLYTAIGFRYALVDSSTVILPADAEEFKEKLSDDYTQNISLAVLYNDYVENLLFFGIENKSTEDLNYDYEIILNPEKEDGTNYPTLYIRAKEQASTSTFSSKNGKVIFAFDMSAFIKHYKDKISNEGPIKFNVKYKIGTDESGKDVYRAFMSNPFSWYIESNKE
jgi:hypothetical protein